MAFGNRVSAILEEKKMQQKDFADSIGIGQVMLSRYLNNKMVPSAIVAGKIAQALGVSLDYLVLGVKVEDMPNASIDIKLQQFEKLSQEDQAHMIAVLEAFTAKARLQNILDK